MSIDLGQIQGRNKKVVRVHATRAVNAPSLRSNPTHVGAVACIPHIALLIRYAGYILAGKKAARAAVQVLQILGRESAHVPGMCGANVRNNISRAYSRQARDALLRSSFAEFFAPERKNIGRRVGITGAARGEEKTTRGK